MDLERFVEAQESVYERALREVRRGRKETHWMWFIFPQIRGLGTSGLAIKYSIADRAEAEAYLAHPLLGARLREISDALLKLGPVRVTAVFDYPDDLKLRSSMTLFRLVSGEAVFQQVLDKYFDGKPDEKTIELLDAKFE